MEIIKLGSIYANGHTYIPGFRRDGNENISLGDTVPGKELQWIQYKGKLIGDRCVCINVSWKQLDEIGYIFGWPVLIDGNCYLCRSLKVGSEEGEPNEWDDVLRSSWYDDSLWHWRNTEFWGQEAPTDSCEVRVVRGYYSATYFSAKRLTMLSTLIGFRPVLEQLPPMPILDEGMIGTRLRMYGEEGYFDTVLADFNDYDITAKLVGEMDFEFSWAQRDGDEVAISRDALVWMERV